MATNRLNTFIPSMVFLQNIVFKRYYWLGIINEFIHGWNDEKRVLCYEDRNEIQRKIDEHRRSKQKTNHCKYQLIYSKMFSMNLICNWIFFFWSQPIFIISIFIHNFKFYTKVFSFFLLSLIKYINITSTASLKVYLFLNRYRYDKSMNFNSMKCISID